MPNFLFDIGFQLSFTSTLGIILIPVLFEKFKSFISGDFLTTISAQIATLPILLFNFGNYSPWSIVVNVLVLWTIPPLMILGGAAAIISFIFQPAAKFFIFLCLPFLTYFESVVTYFAGLGANVAVESFPWQITIAYYLLLSSVLSFMFGRKHK